MGRREGGKGEGRGGRTSGVDVRVALHFGDEDGEFVGCGYACAGGWLFF